MKRSTILKSILLAGFTFALGFSYNYHLPKIESMLLVEVERISEEQLPVRIWPQQLHFHLFPLGVVLEDVRILPKPPLDKYIAPATIKQVGARLAIFPLLRGDIRLSQVFVRNAELSIFLKHELFEGKKGPTKLKIDFQQLYQLPVDEISLEDIQIQGRLDPQNVVFRINDLNLQAENRYQSIFVEIDAPRVQVKPSGPAKPLDVQLELRTLIEAQEMQVSAFKLKADDSFVVASGRLNGDFSVGKVDTGAFDVRTKLHLGDINIWDRIFSLKPSVPTMNGLAEVDLNMEVRKDKGYKVEAEINTHDVVVDKYIIGHAQGHISSDDLKTISSDSLLVENNAGKVEFNKLNVHLEPKQELTTNIKVHHLEVKKLLENLDVHRVPIFVPIQADAACQGVWGDNPEIVCKGKISATRLHVDTGRPRFSVIAEAEEAKIDGQVKATLKQVEYKANIELGKKSKGSSDGVINYDTGFKINYQAEVLDFADVKNLVNLKLAGAMKLAGKTEGTSRWATIDLAAEGTDMWLEDYPLGQVAAKMNYKNGHLLFDNVAGQIDVTRYAGRIGLDLDKSRIRISGQIPFMDLKDIQSLFQRKLTLPIQMQGTGTGTVEAEGPLRFQDLSYDFRSTFYRGQIAKENFDEMVFNVKAKDGLVKTEKFQITKGSGLIEAKGQITPKGEIDMVVVGRSMRLEQSENVLDFGLDLQGLADFTVLIRGQLPRPRVELNGRLSKMVLGDQPAQDSVFKLNFLPDRMEGSGQFLGTTLLSEFTIPYDNEAPFLFKLKTKKWDFTTLFSLVSKSAKQIDFTTAVTMDMQLQAPHGGLWASSGQAKVTEFVIRKGAKSLSAEKPMIFKMKQGTLNTENCVISSGDSYLKFDAAGLTRSNLNASLNGKLDLSILGLFTPFISDLRGNMALTMDLKGTVDKPNLSGSAYVDRGYAKFVEFTHPFSNVRADVLFNGNQILVNALRAEMAGGKISGEGKITFNQNNRPIDVKGTFNEVKLNVPEGFKTQGSGTVAIHGERFPYVMDIHYDVTGGEIISEFGAQSGSAGSVKPSAFLPRFLDENSFHPFTFALDVNLKNPVMVNNSLMQSQVSGRVKVNGTPDRLLMSGSFAPLPGGKVLFHEVPFDISSAFVEYNNNPPNDPKLYLTANTHVTENIVEEGRATQNQFDVNMLVQGRGQNPQLTLTSQPPLGQREIISLLAFGVSGATTGTGADTRTQSENQNANTGAAIGGAIFDKAGGKRVKEAFGVDLKVSSSQAAADTAAQPKVTLSKQWTPKFSASASSTIESNPNNNVKLEYKMNKDMSVVGSWDGRETLHDHQKDTTKDIFGLDLQYKMQFK